jgi:hypothetical protein
VRRSTSPSCTYGRCAAVSPPRSTTMSTSRRGARPGAEAPDGPGPLVAPRSRVVREHWATEVTPGLEGSLAYARRRVAKCEMHAGSSAALTSSSWTTCCWMPASSATTPVPRPSRCWPRGEITTEGDVPRCSAMDLDDTCSRDLGPEPRPPTSARADRPELVIPALRARRLPCE